MIRNNFLITISFLLIFSNVLGQRGSSYPYISGDTFRSIANIIYDEEHPNLKISDIKPGDIIFVKTDY